MSPSSGSKTFVHPFHQGTNSKLTPQVVPVGPKFAIPETYEGFFEILSEDGRSVRCIESVSDLARR